MKRTLALLLGVTLAGCASHDGPDIATLASNSDQLIWEAGQKALEKRNWESARQHFRRIVDGFPQSEYGPTARLALGDSYFREGGTANYILAVSAYRDFLTLFPSHLRSDYAQFQVAEGFFKQRNGPDRDQTSTTTALQEFQRLLELYPASAQVETVRQRILACRQSLARAEFVAGYFYQRTRKACRSALPRYQDLLDDYPDYPQLDEVLFRLGQCLVKAGRPAEAPPHLSRLLDEFPKSSFAASARELLAAIPNLPQPAPAPSPSPSPKPEDGQPQVKP